MEHRSLAAGSSSNSTRSDLFTVIPKLLSRVIGRPRCALASKTTTRHRDITDDMMLEILSRVPGRSLVRLRLVCKRWESMFSDPHFIRLQLRYARKNPTTFFFYPIRGWGEVSFYTFELRAFSSETNARMLVLGNNFTLQMHLYAQKNYRISNACDGLIVFHAMQRTVYVTNPCTRELMDLPNGEFHGNQYNADWPVIGLGFDASIGKYKVVRMFVRVGRLCWECEVLTLGTDHSWRSLGAAPYPISYFSPAYANGYIYWTIFSGVPQGFECILSFDVSREKFTTIQLPQFQPKHNTILHRLHMMFLDGSLCLVQHRWFSDIEGTYSWPLIDIYVLKNHDESVWAKSHSMCFKGEVLEKFRCKNSYILFYPVAIVNGKVLFHHILNKWKLHDPKTRTSSDVILPIRELRSIEERALPFTCSESIVPIKCLRASPSSIT